MADTILVCNFKVFTLCYGVLVITNAQLHSSKSQLRFCAGLNTTHAVLEIYGGENLWQRLLL